MVLKRKNMRRQEVFRAENINRKSRWSVLSLCDPMFCIKSALLKPYDKSWWARNVICQALLCKERTLSWWQWMNYYAALQTVSSSFVLFTSWQAGLRKTARPVRTCTLNIPGSSKAMILFIHRQNKTSRLTVCHENSDVDEEEIKNLFMSIICTLSHQSFLS